MMSGRFSNVSAITVDELPSWWQLPFPMQ